ncbi:MAG: DUF4367 domain-containing protein [Clostridia bacterium]|nr:DUF4367 domain-containing protein [Clostridia bacterium]
MANHEPIGKTRLEEAIGTFEWSYYESLQEAEGTVEYSERYQRKIDKLLKERSARTSVFGKRTAAILLAAVLLCFGVIGISAAKYPSALEWLEKIYGSFTEFFFSSRDISLAPEQIEMIYAPAYIPEDYILKDRYLAQSEVKVVWMNHKEEQIIFLQTILDAKTTVDHEDAKYETRKIGDCKIFVLYKKEKRCYYWTDDDYAYSLIVADTLSDEICMEIIRSVKKES